MLARNKLDRREGVAKLRRKGYEVLAVNAEEMSFDEEFDVVVAGEVIEHMSNPGEFLEAAHKALRPQGRLILSTVNVWCFLYYAFEVANTYRANFVHVCWYDRWTLTNLLNNHRFVIKKLWYYGFPKGRGLRLSHILYVFLIRWPASVLWHLPFLRRFVSPGVVVVCEKAP